MKFDLGREPARLPQSSTRFRKKVPSLKDGIATNAYARLMVPLEYSGKLFSYAMILTRNSYDAEDLVQETYVRAIPAMKRLLPESNIKSWLFTILRNLWLNQIRQRRNPRKLLEIDADESIADLAIDHANDPHALYVSKVETERVREAIEQLPDKFREIIVLREYGELSYHEISRVLDCPMGTVMSRLANARSKLRKLFFQRLARAA